ncbi:Alpha-defensin-related sequence 10 [Microtus ochrogaster]|uniref:Alpha-defensin-related sequence 10 n=1 Tax=Microtus ochrogaster TaxID=79684 RepID=A0A8J6KY73_MICOH|nr:Alpha-defensin-related sequence 10 [Microtus ochrogaster]
MKTLVLFSALMLLAFQAQANPLPEPNEEAKNKEQSGVKDQDVSISFGSPEGSAFQDAAAIMVLVCVLSDSPPFQLIMMKGLAVFFCFPSA